jgi:hypothetical protein
MTKAAPKSGSSRVKEELDLVKLKSERRLNMVDSQIDVSYHHFEIVSCLPWITSSCKHREQF